MRIVPTDFDVEAHTERLKTHGYTITITFRIAGNAWETDTVRVIDVGAGDRAEFTQSSDSVDFASAPVTCTIDQVYGPPPFSN